ncbi:MAG: hypothetical protein K2J65_08015 [Duncaniella sp.]|nr:hypothetical protein [Duncaniella sp.]
MDKAMRITLKDLFHAINILGNDCDVLVDGQGAIAVCPPVKFTKDGMRRFREALNATVEVEYQNDSHRNTYVSDDEEGVNEEAWDLLVSLAGYCSEDKFDKWFEGNTAEII